MPRNLLEERRQQQQSSVKPRNLLTEKRQRESEMQSQRRPGMLENIGIGLGNLGTGLVEGAAQSTYNMGKSAANLGMDVLESFGNSRSLQNSISGDSDFDEWQAARQPEQIQQPINPAEMISGQSQEQLSRVPGMQIQQENPQSSLRSAGQTLGGIVPPALLGGYVGQYGAPIGQSAINAVGMGGSPIASLIARAFGAATVGATEGYVTGDEDRRLASGAFGALTAGASQLGGDLLKARSKNIANQIKGELNSLKADYGNAFETVLQEGEQAGANAFLKKVDSNIAASLEDSSFSKLSNSLAEFNKAPTLAKAHKAQADLNKIVIQATPGSKSYENAIKTQNRLLRNISQAFEDSGAGDLAKSYSEIRKGYAKEVGPYLESKSISSLMDGKIRPEKFSSSLIKDEAFMAKMSKEYPDLLLNESISNILNSKVGQGVAASVGLGLGGSALGAVGAPNFIKKHFK